jgi:GTPase SAR1 family protein
VFIYKFPGRKKRDIKGTNLNTQSRLEEVEVERSFAAIAAYIYASMKKKRRKKNQTRAYSSAKRKRKKKGKKREDRAARSVQDRFVMK